MFIKDRNNLYDSASLYYNSITNCSVSNQLTASNALSRLKLSRRAISTVGLATRMRSGASNTSCTQYMQRKKFISCARGKKIFCMSLRGLRRRRRSAGASNNKKRLQLPVKTAKWQIRLTDLCRQTFSNSWSSSRKCTIAETWTGACIEYLKLSDNRWWRHRHRRQRAGNLPVNILRGIRRPLPASVAEFENSLNVVVR